MNFAARRREERTVLPALFALCIKSSVITCVIALLYKVFTHGR